MLPATKIWAAAWQNRQNELCTQWSVRSAWAFAQSDQTLRCPCEETFGPKLPIECIPKESDQTGRMLRLILSLPWAYRPYCWFWCAQSHLWCMIFSIIHLQIIWCKHFVRINNLPTNQVLKCYSELSICNMSHNMRKPVYTIREQTAQSDQHLCCLLLRKYKTYTC